MTARMRKLLLISFLLTSSITTLAVPVPALNVQDLIERSDLIVVGSIIFVQQVGSAIVELERNQVPAHDMLCKVQLYGILKGTMEGNELSFRYLLPEEPIGYATISAPSYVILFLKRNGNGYQITDPYYPSLPAIPGISVAELKEERALGNIVAQLTAALGSTAAPPSQRQWALYALSTIPKPEVTAALESGLTQSDEDIRLNAAAYLLQRNDLAGLPFAERALLKRPEGVAPSVLHNLAYGISEGVKDPAAVPTLSRLLRAADVETRRAAASALGHVGTMSVEGPLSGALTDPDFQVRYQAVWGLAQVTGQSDWSPNVEVFRTQEQKYIKHWRDWASSRAPSE